MAGLTLLLAAVNASTPSAVGSAPSQTTANPRPASRIVLGQIPARNAPGANPSSATFDGGLPLGSWIALFDAADPAGDLVNLTDGFAAAGRPSLSFDAERILFVGKRDRSAPLSVWEVNLDGSGLRRITDHPTSCEEAVYLSTIYTIDAERPVYQIGFRSRAPDDGIDSLYTCHLDGSSVRRITFSPYGASDLFLLSDGRLLFGMWSPGTGPVADTQGGRASSLFTIHVDGTDLFPFAGVHQPSAVRGMPCETDDGRVVYVEAAPAAGDGGGSLVAVARTRSLRTGRVIARDPAGFYYSPSPMPDGNLLVSYRQGIGGWYGVYVLDPRAGTRLSKVYDAPGWHSVDAVLVRPRPEPPGRSTVVNDRAELAQLYCIDAYLSDTAEGKQIERGQIKRLRVIKAAVSTAAEQAPPAEDRSGRPASRSSTIRETVLGEIPVEADGSFFLDIPPRTPLRLETLGAGGEVLQAMHSWFWVMPAEPRGCIGCHEDRELTPPNRHVSALRKEPRKINITGRPQSSKPGAPSDVEGQGR